MSFRIWRKKTERAVTGNLRSGVGGYERRLSDRPTNEPAFVRNHDMQETRDRLRGNS